MTAHTCDQCLDGRHARCQTRGTCPCRSCGGNAPRPYPTTTRKSSKPARAPVGPPGRPGRPRSWLDEKERKREYMRARRARERGEVYTPTEVVVRSPAFAAEVARLESVIHG